MTLPVAYLPEARDDIDDAYVVYEARFAGLGDRLLKSVRRCVERVAQSPHLYAVVEADVRAAPIKRFPHLVFYRIEGERILVVAVQHGRRSWQAWRERT